MKTIQQLTQDIIAGRPVEVEAAWDALDRYPYFTLPAKALLNSPEANLSETQRSRLLNMIAVNSTDETDRINLANNPSFSRSEEAFYPDDAPVKVTTENAIDTFLSTYGSTSPEEDAILERMIFNPTPDYAKILDREEQKNVPAEGEATPGSNDDLINSFIRKQKKRSGELPEETPQPAAPKETRRRAGQSSSRSLNNTPLSMSLAKIFIKQRHYERAYEIISQLNLNYPEKSIYFADQLRFLRKVIAIQKQKNNKKPQ